MCVISLFVVVEKQQSMLIFFKLYYLLMGTPQDIWVCFLFVFVCLFLFVCFCLFVFVCLFFFSYKPAASQVIVKCSLCLQLLFCE